MPATYICRFRPSSDPATPAFRFQAATLRKASPESTQLYPQPLSLLEILLTMTDQYTPLERIAEVRLLITDAYLLQPHMKDVLTVDSSHRERRVLLRQDKVHRLSEGTDCANWLSHPGQQRSFRRGAQARLRPP